MRKNGKIESLAAEYKKISDKMYVYYKADKYSKLRISQLGNLVSKILEYKEPISKGNIRKAEILERTIRQDIRKSSGKIFRRSTLANPPKSQLFW